MKSKTGTFSKLGYVFKLQDDLKGSVRDMFLYYKMTVREV